MWSNIHMKSEVMWEKKASLSPLFRFFSPPTALPFFPLTYAAVIEEARQIALLVRLHREHATAPPRPLLHLFVKRQSPMRLAPYMQSVVEPVPKVVVPRA
jgi:hypothetical protein